ncbi:MAG: hypothetical protein KY476_11400, partial [Planctomycetes bacterium]|nr:hypothetical protein [Planctomycetota bacterium]
AARVWRTDGWCVCDVDEENPYTRTIPAVDPSPFGPDGTPLGSLYYQTARSQRQDLATHYLELWIQDWLGPYFAWDDQDRPGRQTAKMSQFINLWRIFTCAHLRTLLDEEYPHNNLPHVLRQTPLSDNDRHDREHTLIAVAYWPHLSEAFPGLFRNPIARDGSDAQAFAQVRLFIPQRRHLCCPWAWPRPVTVRQPDGTIVTRIEWVNNMENRPSHWDLINQKWTAKLVPATSPAVLPILQTQPPGLAWFRPPRLGDATMEHVSAVNTH